MAYSSETLAEMLAHDLGAIGMSQRELAAKLADDHEPALTEAAISNWKKSNKIPRKRLERIIEILGPNSRIARAREQGAINSNGEIEARAFLTFGSQDAIYPTKAAEPVAMHAYARYSAGVGKTEGELARLAFAEALPPELRQYVSQRVPVGRVAIHMDYASPNVAANIRLAHNQAMAFGAVRAAWNLSVLKAVGRHKVYGLILVGMPEMRLGLRLEEECRLVGLDLKVVSTAEDAAHLVAAWETWDASDTSADELEEPHG